MGAKGLLVDYEWCSGCHTCEVACQLEHGYPSDQWGIKVHEVGPWEYAPKTWQYSVSARPHRPVRPVRRPRCEGS